MKFDQNNLPYVYAGSYFVFYCAFSWRWIFKNSPREHAPRTPPRRVDRLDTVYFNGSPVCFKSPRKPYYSPTPSTRHLCNTDTSPLETVLFIPKTTYFRLPGHRMYELSVRNWPFKNWEGHWANLTFAKISGAVTKDTEKYWPIAYRRVPIKLSQKQLRALRDAVKLQLPSCF